MGHRVALVIGNSAYTTVPDLPHPVSDAGTIAATLREVGFQVVTLDDDLTRNQFLDALGDFAKEADTADWAAVYYAGHGIEMNGTNYLIPVDTKLASDRDVEFEAIPLDRVISAVDGAKKPHVVILDACRNNPFHTRKTSATRSIGRGLARVEPNTGTLVVYAAKDGETALDGDGSSSPFVAALVQRLPTQGIEIGKLFRLVRDDVLKATDNQQDPPGLRLPAGRGPLLRRQVSEPGSSSPFDADLISGARNASARRRPRGRPGSCPRKNADAKLSF
jgi:uncharacterized caspase-like protein